MPHGTPGTIPAAVEWEAETVIRMKPGQCLPCPRLLQRAGWNLGTPKGLGHPVPTYLVALVQAPHGLERQWLRASSPTLPLLL